MCNPFVFNFAGTSVRLQKEILNLYAPFDSPQIISKSFFFVYLYVIVIDCMHIQDLWLKKMFVDSSVYLLNVGKWNHSTFLC